MKTQVFDRFGGGLLVLIMLTIAVVAGQAEPKFDEPSRTENAFELNAGFEITILDHPIRIEASIEESNATTPESADSSNALVQ